MDKKEKTKRIIAVLLIFGAIVLVASGIAVRIITSESIAIIINLVGIDVVFGSIITSVVLYAKNIVDVDDSVDFTRILMYAGAAFFGVTMFGVTVMILIIYFVVKPPFN